MEKLLISPATIKAEGLLDDNVSDETIGVAIKLSQDLGLQPIIGSNLLSKLCDLTNAGITGPANINYKNLLDNYITDYLAYNTLSEIQIPLAYKTKNIGVYTADDQVENRKTAPITEIQYIKNFYANKSEFYAARLSDYLCHNINLFPEFSQPVAGGDLRGNLGKPFRSTLNVY